MSKSSDCWRSPKWLFDELNEEFNFTHDLCADKTNHLCENWFEDYLTADFKNGVGYCNPPYSCPKPFVEKCWNDSLHNRIIMLVKCDPSTKWWATFWLYDVPLYHYQAGSECYTSFIELTKDARYLVKVTKYNGPKPGCEVRFFPKRIKFDPPACLNLEIKGNKYAIRCDDFETIGSSKNSFLDKSSCKGSECLRCKGTGKRWANLAGASFPCALVIMDRRGL